MASWRSLWVPWEGGKLWEGVLYGKLRKGGGSGRSNVSSFSSHWHPQTFTDAKGLITALISPKKRTQQEIGFRNTLLSGYAGPTLALELKLPRLCAFQPKFAYIYVCI